jgi:predicted RNA-binding Zn-ribbon protein involved in translation (DUF1610 family)
MVGVGDIVELLKRWDRWKRIDEAPERIDALEKRIAELESRLQRWPGEACPACGELEFRVTSSRSSGRGMRHLGARDYSYKCQKCGFEDIRMITPALGSPR